MALNVLDGLSILLVEDEPAVARAIGLFLQSMGAAIVGPASTVAEALTLGRSSTFDVAVLDFKLKGEVVTSFADFLIEEGRRFLFYTSSLQASVDYPKAVVIMKPSRFGDIVTAILHVLHEPPAG